MAPDRDKTPVHPSAFGCITLPFLLAACVTLGWGARANWVRGQLQRDGTTVSGRVTALRYVAENPAVVEKPRGGGSARGESPVVAFTTREGTSRTVVGSVNRYPPPWTVGDTVDVVYDPQSPDRADLVSEVTGWRLWFGVWCAVAFVPLLIAAIPLWLLVRQRTSGTSA
jgi:hypothetical protein